MITKNDAIKAGKAICDAARRMSEENDPSVGDLHATISNRRHAARGACIYAMDNLWYDVMPNRIREQFSFQREKFYEVCGWPD